MVDIKLIQSYGRKRAQGLSVSQKNDLITLYNLYGIYIPDIEFHPNSLFKKNFPSINMEIGFGRGEHLIESAIANPNEGFIGCEPFENGVVNTLREIHNNKLENIKIFNGDARLLLEKLQDNTINKFYILFPDPWPKKRHYKRRILSNEFIKTLQKKGILPSTELYFATDCVDYIQYVLKNLKTLNILCNNDITEFSNKPNWFTRTRYEQKALSQGKTCYYLNVNLS